MTQILRMLFNGDCELAYEPPQLSVFLAVTIRNIVGGYSRFGGARCLHLHTRG